MYKDQRMGKDFQKFLRTKREQKIQFVVKESAWWGNGQETWKITGRCISHRVAPARERSTSLMMLSYPSGERYYSNEVALLGNRQWSAFDDGSEDHALKHCRGGSLVGEETEIKGSEYLSCSPWKFITINLRHVPCHCPTSNITLGLKESNKELLHNENQGSEIRVYKTLTRKG